MPITRLLFLMVALTFSSQSYSQSPDFAAVDKFAISIGKADSSTIPQLTYALTDRYKDPVLKARSIYTWIANNIAYDCPAYHSEGRRKGAPQDVFKARKAVCEGYANLYREMCSLAGVQCITIDGYARNMSATIGEELEEPNHTWNAVRIDNVWKMVDVTWGSGYTDKKVKTFTPQFNDHCFFTDPYKLLVNHYPKIESWKPAKARLSKKEFFNSPTVGEGYFTFGITSVNPENGIIKVKPDKGVPISFTSTNIDEIKRVTVILGEDKKQVLLQSEFHVAGNTISLNISYGKPEVYPVTIFINDIATLTYQLEVQE